MNADTITERLHQQSDDALKIELDAMFQKLWNEMNPQGQKYPAMTPEMRSSITNAGLKARENDETCPYIGALQQLYKQVAFAYLAPRRRSLAVSDFMARVEQMSEQLGQLQQDVANIDAA